MLEKIKQRIVSMRFRYKVSLVFAVLLFLIVGVISLQQIIMMNQVRYTDAQDNLSLLTEQVSINFSQQLKQRESQLYSSMEMYNLPQLMRTFLSSGNINEVQLALNLMLYSTSPYDFVMVLSPNGTEVSAVVSRINNGQTIKKEATELLKNSNECGYGTCEWYRGENGDIYLIRDIYSTSPLTYCGRIVAHMKPSYIFSLGLQSQQLDYTFLFFTSENRLLLSSGTLDSVLRDDLNTLHSQTELRNGLLTIGDKEYFVSSDTKGKIETVGITPLNYVRKTSAAITQVIIGIAVVGLVAGALVLALCMRTLTRQLDSIISVMDSMASGKLHQKAEVISKDDIGQLAIHFNTMSEQITLLLRRIVKEQKLKTQAQFKLLEYQYRSLQTQLSPHFIFNALETVNAMAKIDGNSELSRNILLISHYFRLVTANMNREFITVINEFGGLYDYAEIYKSIQGSSLSVSFHCEDSIQEAVIPVMILQPILENALVHGMNSARKASSIEVCAKPIGPHKLLVTVSDNGPGITEEQKEKLLSKKSDNSAKHTGVGLKNVMERLDLLYGTDASVGIRSDEKGTCISVELPIDFEVPVQLSDIQ